MATLLHDWHRLMAFVGVHGPLVQTSAHFTRQKSSLLSLPFEIRSPIYEHLLPDADAYEAHPTIIRTPSGHLCIHLQRPPTFSHLLLACKQINAEAAPLPFLHQPFRLHFCTAYLVQDPWKRIPHNDAIGNAALRMPRHLVVSLTLDELSGNMLQLTRLHLMLEARRDEVFETRVTLSLAKLAEVRKRAVLHSLAAFLKGHHALVTVEGTGDVLEDGTSAVFRYSNRDATPRLASTKPAAELRRMNAWLSLLAQDLRL